MRSLSPLVITKWIVFAPHCTHVETAAQSSSACTSQAEPAGGGVGVQTPSSYTKTTPLNITFLLAVTPTFIHIIKKLFFLLDEYY